MQGCLTLIILLAIWTAGGLCAEYVVEFWATYLKGVPVDIPFLPAFLGGMLIGPVTFTLAVITWIFSFCL
jgi:hypothetical protein